MGHGSFYGAGLVGRLLLSGEKKSKFDFKTRNKLPQALGLSLDSSVLIGR